MVVKCDAARFEDWMLVRLTNCWSSLPMNTAGLFCDNLLSCLSVYAGLLNEDNVGCTER